MPDFDPGVNAERIQPPQVNQGGVPQFPDMGKFKTLPSNNQAKSGLEASHDANSAKSEHGGFAAFFIWLFSFILCCIPSKANIANDEENNVVTASATDGLMDALNNKSQQEAPAAMQGGGTVAAKDSQKIEEQNAQYVPSSPTESPGSSRSPTPVSSRGSSRESSPERELDPAKVAKKEARMKAVEKAKEGAKALREAEEAEKEAARVQAEKRIAAEKKAKEDFVLKFEEILTEVESDVEKGKPQPTPEIKDNEPKTESDEKVSWGGKLKREAQQFATKVKKKGAEVKAKISPNPEEMEKKVQRIASEKERKKIVSNAVNYLRDHGSDMFWNTNASPKANFDNFYEFVSNSHVLVQTLKALGFNEESQKVKTYLGQTLSANETKLEQSLIVDLEDVVLVEKMEQLNKWIKDLQSY